MQVRVFESADMASGLKLVRKELGPDALILSTRTIHNGKLGLFGKPSLEITAAIDTPWPSEKQSLPRTDPPKKLKPKKQKADAAKTTTPRINLTVGDDVSMNLATADGKETPTDFQPSGNSTASSGPVDTADDTVLRSEVNELKNLVSNLAGEIARITPQTKPVPAESESPADLNSLLQSRLTPLQKVSDPVSNLLNQHGITGEVAQTICTFTRESLSAHQLADSKTVRSFLIQTIQNLIDVQPPQFSDRNRQHRIALVGPTGVGKTTTLAKLAAHYLANHSSSIAMITIDTYRIAAVEQLKVYGEIMHVPVDVVISPEQLQEAIAQHQDKSLILIDTAGRSPRDSLCIDELSTFLRSDLDIEKHLVLSASTRENELLDAINRFKPLGIDRTIFTKVDESSQNGIILNVQIQNNAPLSYITNGQRVPEDLLEITSLSAAELIMSHHEGTTHD